MRIEEIFRACTNEAVAEAAVASIGGLLSARVRDAAAFYDLSVGSFTALSIRRFQRQGDEGEMRSVVEAMKGSQEPCLAGLHRMLCIMLAAGLPVSADTRHVPSPRNVRLSAQLCAMESDPRRGIYI